jgi:predicted lactoylglutathione lyase
MVFQNNTFSLFHVADFERSQEFFDAVLGELNISRCVNQEGGGIREAEYGRNEDKSKKVLAILESPESIGVPRLSGYVDFWVKSRNVVDVFYATALAKGATTKQEPCLQDKSYFAAVLDLDGHEIRASYTEGKRVGFSGQLLVAH